MSSKPTPVIVSRRFRGPTTSANGGYVCGLLAALAPFPVTVRLLKPPPLETRLEAETRDGRLVLRHGDTVLAEARPGEVGDLVPPPAPSYEDAVAASGRFAGFSKHFAPECFVCGPARPPGEGLRLFAGPLARGTARDGPAAARGDGPGTGGVAAAPWIPDASLDAGDGLVALEFMWAALDCPGYLAVAGDMRAMLLGELTARVARRVRIGERCVVVGWHIRSAGRKHEVGTAVFGAEQDVCAVARALWIEPRANVADASGLQSTT
jgi:hypothetical protein